jgi:hypothetical protein
MVTQRQQRACASELHGKSHLRGPARVLFEHVLGIQVRGPHV